MAQASLKQLLEAGFREYLPMYFARNGHEFLGEEHYFRLKGDYFGFGSGAHSNIAHHLLASVNE